MVASFGLQVYVLNEICFADAGAGCKVRGAVIEFQSPFSIAGTTRTLHHAPFPHSPFSIPGTTCNPKLATQNETFNAFLIFV